MANPGAIRRVLSFRNARIFYSGSLLSWTGMWVQRIAVGWLAWELTGSAFWVAALVFCNLVPSVIVSPLAGAAADRADRIRLTVITQIICCVHGAVLAGLVLAGLVSIEILLVFEVILGVTQAFAQPVRQSLVPGMVPRSELSSAVAMNSIVFNIARFLGPAIAGPMIAAWGTAPAMLVNSAGYLFACLTLPLMTLAPEYRRGHTPTGSLWSETVEGFTYIARNTGIGGIILYAALMATLLRPVPEMLPPFVDLVFGRGAGGLALLTAVMGVAALLGGLAVAMLSSLRGQTGWAIHGGLAMAFGTGAFAATDSFAMALVAIAVIGAATTVHGTASQSLIQYSCAPSMLGRALSAWGLIVRAFPALGALVFGALSEWFGLRIPILVAVGVSVLVWIWALRNKTRFAGALEPKD